MCLGEPAINASRAERGGGGWGEQLSRRDDVLRDGGGEGGGLER